MDLSFKGEPIQKQLGLYQPFAYLLIRILFGIRLIYGTIDNIVSWERMLEFKTFLEFHHFPFPLVSAITSVYFQFFAGICWIIGFKVRLVSLFMVINFIVAIIGVHLTSGDTYTNTEPALHLLVISVFLLTCGAGKWSLDYKMNSKMY